MATTVHKTQSSKTGKNNSDNNNRQKSNASNRGDANNTQPGGQSRNLSDSPMMAHLMDALEKGTDVGHYGRLVFAMVARHFLDEDKIVSLLANQPDQDEASAAALLQQVTARDYNPPKRERILEWQAQQDFQICPNSDDPNACNVYSELRFPDGIYDNINEYYEEQASE